MTNEDNAYRYCENHANSRSLAPNRKCVICKNVITHNRAVDMKYRKQWDLTTIPFEVIPDDLLRSWWAQRNGKKGGRPIKDDPATEAKRKAERERIRALRSGSK